MMSSDNRSSTEEKGWTQHEYVIAAREAVAETAPETVLIDTAVFYGVALLTVHVINGVTPREFGLLGAALGPLVSAVTISTVAGWGTYTLAGQLHDRYDRAATPDAHLVGSVPGHVLVALAVTGLHFDYSNLVLGGQSTFQVVQNGFTYYVLGAVVPLVTATTLHRSDSEDESDAQGSASASDRSDTDIPYPAADSTDSAPGRPEEAETSSGEPDGTVETSPSGQDDGDEPAPDPGDGTTDSSGEDAETSRQTADGTDRSAEAPESDRGGDDGDDAERAGWTFPWTRPSATPLTFEDVGGLDETKAKLERELLEPLQEAARYERFGVTIPDILLHGPPGTGKTYLARALAGEIECPHVELSGGDINSKWINESSQNVNRLFREAHHLGERSGHALVFIDEIDALTPERGGPGHQENDKVVDEFLAQLQDTGNDVTVVLATNRPDDLDPAVTRSGRVDAKIEVPLPDREARRQILDAQLADRPTSPRLPLAETNVGNYTTGCAAQETDGWNAADLATAVNHAARRAVEQGHDTILPEDLRVAIEALEEPADGASDESDGADESTHGS